MSVIAGETITAAQLSTLAALANTKLGNKWPLKTDGSLDAGGTPASFAFGSSGWKTELHRLRANAAKEVEDDALWSLAKSGPWPTYHSTAAAFEICDGTHLYYNEPKFISKIQPTKGWFELEFKDWLMPAVAPLVTIQSNGEILWRLYAPDNVDLVCDFMAIWGDPGDSWGHQGFDYQSWYAWQGPDADVYLPASPPPPSPDVGCNFRIDFYGRDLDDLDDYYLYIPGWYAVFCFNGTIPAGDYLEFGVILSGTSCYDDAEPPTYYLAKDGIIHGNLQFIHKADGTGNPSVKSEDITPVSASQLARSDLWEIDYATDFVEEKEKYIEAEYTSIKLYVSPTTEGIFVAKSPPITGLNCDPLGEDGYPNADERIVRWATFGYRVVNPYASLPAPYPPGRIVAGEFGESGGWDGHSYYTGNAQYHWENALSGPFSPRYSSLFKMASFPMQRDTAGDIWPAQPSHQCTPFQFGPNPSSDFSDVRYGKIYSVTARRAPENRDGTKCQKALADIGTALTVKFGTLIAGAFVTLHTMTIAGGTWAQTDYPACIILFDDMPLFWQCTEQVWVDATIACTALLDLKTWLTWEVGEGETCMNVNWPIAAAFYNDTETILNDLTT